VLVALSLADAGLAAATGKATVRLLLRLVVVKAVADPRLLFCFLQTTWL
jgi:hypothetical protein